MMDDPPVRVVEPDDAFYERIRREMRQSRLLTIASAHGLARQIIYAARSGDIAYAGHLVNSFPIDVDWAPAGMLRRIVGARLARLTGESRRG